LYGSNAFEAGLVDQWIDYFLSGPYDNARSTSRMIFGKDPVNMDCFNDKLKELKDSLKPLNTRLTAN
jgi:hypothetical protein